MLRDTTVPNALMICESLSFLGQIYDLSIHHVFLPDVISRVKDAGGLCRGAELSLTNERTGSGDCFCPHSQQSTHAPLGTFTAASLELQALHTDIQQAASQHVAN